MVLRGEGPGQAGCMECRKLEAFKCLWTLGDHQELVERLKVDLISSDPCSPASLFLQPLPDGSSSSRGRHHGS